jgi:hypothetical protein
MTWAKALGLDEEEIQGLMRCVCRWPNYLQGACLVCGRKEPARNGCGVCQKIPVKGQI